MTGCYALGLLQGQGGGFDGGSRMTRAQAAVVLCRLADLMEGAAGQPQGTRQEGGVLGGKVYDQLLRREAPQPSTGMWNGWQGRAYGSKVDGADDLAGVLSACMDGYPQTVVFFSGSQLAADRPRLQWGDQQVDTIAPSAGGAGRRNLEAFEAQLEELCALPS